MNQKNDGDAQTKPNISSKTTITNVKKKVSIDILGKSDSQSPRNHDIKYFSCLGISHITSQYLNKIVMILCNYRDVETKSDNDDQKMLSLENACDYEVKYSIEGESLIVKSVLNV